MDISSIYRALDSAKIGDDMKRNRFIDVNDIESLMRKSFVNIENAELALMESTVSDILLFYRFENTKISITVTYELYSHETLVEIGRLSKEEKYNIGEISKIVFPGRIIPATCQTENIHVLGKYISTIIKFLVEDGRSLLSGEEDVFNKISLEAGYLRRKYTLHAQYDAFLRMGDDAWRKKKWQEALKFYENCKLILDPTRKKRLGYLSKKTGIVNSDENSES